MIRLLLRLLGIRDFEVCPSCETLKQQLEYERANNKELTDTLLAIVNPKVVQSIPPAELNPVAVTSGLFSRRRAALEARDRIAAQIQKDSKNLGQPDRPENTNSLAVEKLEEELGITEEKNG